MKTLPRAAFSTLILLGLGAAARPAVEKNHNPPPADGAVGLINFILEGHIRD